MHHSAKYTRRCINLQKLEIGRIECAGLMLDIGGGGENIIGQMMQDRAVVIDKNVEELMDAPPGGLKIVMDALELKFLDKVFPAVSSFFCLMYIRNDQHPMVFKEIHRVLMQGGRLLVWDLCIPARPEGAEDIYMMPIEIRFGSKVVKTGYGTLWQDKCQTPEYFAKVAEKTGFTLVNMVRDDQIFFIEFRKL